MAYCAECTYLNIDYRPDPDLYGRFYCEKKLERMPANAMACYSFCRAYRRSDSVIENAIRYSNDNSSSPSCYITTMMCNTLKIPNTHYILNTMRGFRDNYLQKDESYKKLLVEYDIIGPMIAKCIDNDPLKIKLSINYLYKYIKPILKLINEEKYIEAINLYIKMTEELKLFYNLNGLQIDDELVDKADISKSGHGVYVKQRTL